MKRFVRRTRAADDDLFEIWDYIAEHSYGAADELINALDDKFHLLAEFPLIGHARNDIPSGMRSFPHGHYVIIYRPDLDGVEIIRALHGSRDFPTIFEQH